jgi:hypothetical protein
MLVRRLQDQLHPPTSASLSSRMLTRGDSVSNWPQSLTLHRFARDLANGFPQGRSAVPEQKCLLRATVSFTGFAPRRNGLVGQRLGAFVPSGAQPRTPLPPLGWDHLQSQNCRDFGRLEELAEKWLSPPYPRKPFHRSTGLRVTRQRKSFRPHGNGFQGRRV